MAVTEKNSSPSAAPLPSRTSSSPLSLRTHRPAADFKFKSPSPARGHCPLQGLGHNDTPSSARRQAPAGSPDDEQEDSFPNFIRCKTEEYSKRIRKLQDDYLYPLKEDLAEWINRVLQTSELSAENFIEKLDNGVLILRMAKIIESQCNIFESMSSTLSRNGSTTNGHSGNNVNNIVPPNGVLRVRVSGRLCVIKRTTPAVTRSSDFKDDCKDGKDVLMCFRCRCQTAERRAHVLFNVLLSMHGERRAQQAVAYLGSR